MPSLQSPKADDCSVQSDQWQQEGGNQRGPADVPQALGPEPLGARSPQAATDLEGINPSITSLHSVPEVVSPPSSRSKQSGARSKQGRSDNDLADPRSFQSLEQSQDSSLSSICPEQRV